MILIAGNAGNNGHAAWGEAQIEFMGQAPIAVAAPAVGRVRLTPPASPLPRLNGARIFGVRPGAPLLFQIAASGQRPLRFSAKLPKGVRLDAQTGLLTGALAKKGRYSVPVTVSNALGQAKRDLIIQVGDDILLTPPMGWNSWYQMSESVSDAGVRKVARAMKDKGLTDYGWTYVNIDDCWQGERGGPELALQPNERFPDMTAMCDFLHGHGLKAGIYSTPWIGTYAGFRGSTAPLPGGTYPAALPPGKRLQAGQIFGRSPGVRRLQMNKSGPHWFFDRDARQIAAWGFDYIKMDWNPNDGATTARIASDLRASGRDIALSLSNHAPFENAAHLSSLAQAWRNTTDIHDNWGSILGIANAQERWLPFTRPGHWNDPDMLQIGDIGVPNQFNTVSKPTNLTPDEQYFQVSLWSLLSAPLLLSCDISSLDDFTLGLVTNAEVIAVDQDVLGKPARRIPLGENRFAWVKPLEDGSLAVGLFNTDEIEGEVSFPLQSLGLGRTFKVRDVWRQKDLGQFSGEFKTLVNSHGVVLLRLSF